MKKTLKIFFPLLVIVGVLFALLVPVSADDTPVYNGEFYSIYSDNSPFAFFGSDEYFVKSDTSIRSIGECNGMSCLFQPGEGFSLACQKNFTVHFVFSSSMPFSFGFVKQDNNGDVWFYSCFTYNPSSGALLWSGSSQSYTVDSSVSITYKIDLVNSYVYFCLPPFAQQEGSYFSRLPKVLIGNSSETVSPYPFFLFSPDSSSEEFTFEDFSYFSKDLSYNVTSAHYLLSYGTISGFSAGYGVGFDRGESSGYSSGRSDGYGDGYSVGQADGEALHENDYANGQRYGEALHAADFENGYNSGVASGTNVITDTVDGVFDGLLSTLGVLNGFSIFGITLGGIISVVAILLIVFFALKVIRK
ncbi:MAG: hypothetical protein IK090_03940 [Clostridia bacterium]|nr:hypothetical protein [Clostridia bacterium]